MRKLTSFALIITITLCLARPASEASTPGNVANISCKGKQVLVRKPVYLAHGIYSDNNAWGTGIGFCMRNHLKRRWGYKEDDNLFMAGAGSGESDGFTDSGSRSVFDDMKQLDKDLEFIRDKVPPELAAHGCSATYRDLGMKVDVIAHSKSGVTAELYLKNTDENGFLPADFKQRYTNYSNGEVVEKGFKDIPIYKDSIGTLVELGSPVKGSGNADKAHFVEEKLSKSRLGRTLNGVLGDVLSGGFDMPLDLSEGSHEGLQDLTPQSRAIQEVQDRVPPQDVNIVRIYEDRFPNGSDGVVQSSETRGGEGPHDNVSRLRTTASFKISHGGLKSDPDTKKDITDALGMRDGDTNAGDNADDNEDLSTAPYLPRSNLSERFYELAAEKEKNWVLKYKQLQEVESQLRNANTLSGAQIDALLLKRWELRPQLDWAREQVFREYEETPNIAVLDLSFSTDAGALFASVGEPVSFVSETFDPTLYDHKQLLVVPSGALKGFDGSKFFKARLDEFVKQGGVLLCFTQPYGYLYDALPPMKGNKLGGFGWWQDQSCYFKGSYLDQVHPVLKGQADSNIDVYTDGYFTEWPENAITPIRRTKNDAPSVVIYPYGKGWVAATTLYMDWGFTHQQFSKDEEQLLKDLITWAKEPSKALSDQEKKALQFEPRQSEEVQLFITSDAEQYGPGATALFTVHLTNKSDQARTYTLYYVFPHSSRRNPHVYGAVIHKFQDTPKSTLSFELTVGPGETKEKQVDVPVITTEDAMWVWMYDEQDKYFAGAGRTMHMVETDIALKVRPPSDLGQGKGAIKIDVDSWVLKGVDFFKGLRMVLGMVDPSYKKVYEEEQTLDLDRNGIKTVSFDIPRTGKKGFYTLRAEIFQGEEKLGLGSGYIRIAGPIFSIAPEIQGPIGEKLNSEFRIRNLGVLAPVRGTFRATLADPSGATLLSVEKELKIDSEFDFTVPFAVESLGPLILGDYKLMHELTWADEKVGGTEILPNEILVGATLDKNSYDARDPWKLNITLENEGRFTQDANLHVKIPAFGYEGNPIAGIKPSETKHIVLEGIIQNDATLGVGQATVALQVAGAKTAIATFHVREPDLIWELASSDYSGGSDLPIRLSNEGGMPTTARGSVTLQDLSGTALASTAIDAEIAPGAFLASMVRIPSTLRSGPYAIVADVQDVKRQHRTVMKKPIAIQGVEVSVDAKLSAESLTNGDSLQVEAFLKALGLDASFDGTLRAAVIRKGLSPPEKWDAYNAPPTTTAFAIDGDEVWVAFTRTLIRYNRITKKWKSIPRQPPETYHAFNIHKIIPQDNDVWLLGQTGGVSRYDKKRAQWENYLFKAPLSADPITALAFDGSIVWFLGAKTIDRWDRSANEWLHFKAGKEIPYSDFQALATHDGEAWLGTAKGIFQYSTFGARWDPVLLDENILDIAVNDEEIWLAIDISHLEARFEWKATRIGRYDRIEGTWQFYQNDYSDGKNIVPGNSPIPSAQVREVRIDGDWVWLAAIRPGGFPTGISRYNIKEERWQVFPDLSTPIEAQGCLKIGKKYVVAGYNKLFVFDKENEEWKVYLQKEGLFKTPSNHLAFLDSSQEVWMEQYLSWSGHDGGNGFVTFNVATGKWEKVYVGLSGQVERLVSDEKESLWFQTAGQGLSRNDGLTRYDWKTDEWETITSSPGGMLRSKFWSLLPDGQDLWVGHDDGISRYNKKEDKWYRYHGAITVDGEKLEPTLPWEPDSIVRTIASDANYVWFMSHAGNYLLRYEKASADWERFRIPIHSPHRMAVTDDAVWLASEYHPDVGRFDKKWEEFTQINLQDAPHRFRPRVRNIISAGEDVWVSMDSRREDHHYVVQRLHADGRISKYYYDDIGVTKGSTFLNVVRRGDEFLFAGGGGIWRFNNKTEKWSIVTPKEGELQSAEVGGLGLYGREVWVGTKAGVNIWIPETNAWSKYPAEGNPDGIFSRQFVFGPDPGVVWGLQNSSDLLFRMKLAHDNSKPVWAKDFQVRVGEMESLTATIDGLFGAGEYELILELYNEADQLLASDVSPFTIKEGKQLVTVGTDKEFYLPGALAQIDVRVANPSKAPVQGVPVGLFYGEEESFFERWDLEAGEGRSYSVGVTATKDKHLRSVAGDTVVDRVLDVRQPALESTLNSPDIAGQGAFPVTILLNNTGEADLQLKVKLVGLKDFGSVNLPAGRQLTFSTPLAITADTTLDLEITGDMYQTAQRTIVYGVKFEAKAAVPGKMLEGTMSLPWTLENVGLTSATASVRVRLLDDKNKIVTEQARLAHIEKGKKFSGALDAKLNPGQYRLEFSGDGGISSSPFSVHAIAPLKLFVEDKGFLNGRHTYKVRVENPPDRSAKAILRRTFAGSIEEHPIDLKSEESQDYDEALLLGGLAVGKHTISYEVLEKGKPTVSWSGEVNIPKGEIKLVPPTGPIAFTVGATAKLTFQVANNTSADVSQTFTFLVDGLVKEFRTILAAAYETVTPDFFFAIPDDFPQGLVQAEYAFGEVQGTVALSLAGPKVGVSWGLDKAAYAVGDTATLNLQVENLGQPWSMAALVRYKGFEETQHFELAQEKQLVFEIPIKALDEEKMFLSINTDTGRSLYINRFDLTAASALVEVSLDKRDYDTGDTVTIHVVPQKSGSIRLSGIKGFLVEEVISAPRTYTFTLPESMAQQTVFVDYTFEGITGRVPFNVRGDRLLIVSGQFVRSGDTCQATWKVLSNRAMNARLVISVAGGDVSAEVVQVDRTITLSEGENILKESLSCEGISTGLAHIRTAIYFEGSDQAGPAAVFDGAIDEGKAAVLSVKTDKDVYEPGEPITIQVVSFGEDPTPMKLMSESGSVMWNGTVTYNSVTQTTLAVSSLGVGEHSLTIQLGDSAPSTQQLRVVVQAPPAAQPIEPDPTPTPTPAPAAPSVGVSAASPAISTAGVTSTTTLTNRGPTINAARVRVMDGDRRPRQKELGSEVSTQPQVQPQLQVQATEAIAEEVAVVEDISEIRVIEEGSEDSALDQPDPIVREIPKPIAPVRQPWDQELVVPPDGTTPAKAHRKIPPDVLWRIVQMVLLVTTFGGGWIVYARARRARLRALKQRKGVGVNIYDKDQDKVASR